MITVFGSITWIWSLQQHACRSLARLWRPAASRLLTYLNQLFDAGTISDMAARYERLLVQIVDNPDRRLSTLTPLSLKEIASRIAISSGPERHYSTGLCVYDIVLAQAKATPDSGVSCDERESQIYFGFRISHSP